MKTSRAQALAKQSNIHESVASALLVLIGFQLLGEILSRTLSMPQPGPVIGMFLLMAVIAYRLGSTLLSLIVTGLVMHHMRVR